MGGKINDMKENKDSAYFVLVLKNYAQRRSITHQAISEKTGISRPHLNRIFNLRYSPRTDMLFSIVKALDLDISIQDSNGGKDLEDAGKDARLQLKEFNIW